MHWALRPLLALVVACSDHRGRCQLDESRRNHDHGGHDQHSFQTPRASTMAIDVAGEFGAALAATSANYRFESVVAVGDQTITTITGVVDGESVAATISAGTSDVSYVRTPDGEWVTGPDDEWGVLEGEAPAGAPLAGLTDAGDFALESSDAGLQTILATLGTAAGPVAGTRVTITLTNGQVTQIRYQAQSGSELADVTTTITDIGAAGTVEAPPV